MNPEQVARSVTDRIRSAYLDSQVPDGNEDFYRGIDAASANLFAILDECDDCYRTDGTHDLDVEH